MRECVCMHVCICMYLCMSAYIQGSSYTYFYITLLLHISEVPVSNLGQNAGYPVGWFFYGFPQYLQANAETIP
jgi:hypothetical protein